ncbi:MAG: DUF2293 domain-containing protein [Planctomycetota bacterium]
MQEQIRVVRKSPRRRRVLTEDGTLLRVPEAWSLLPPGDAALTRRTKKAGPHWLVQQKKGRRVFSQGVWAPTATIERIRNELEKERSTEQYAKRKKQAKVRRDQQQSDYVNEFRRAVLTFLDFDARYEQLAGEMAEQISRHATPVGSGTVARTKRIPIERRAGSAVIAWLRHHTTEYDSMKIERVKGRRREVRRKLASQSKRLLQFYRDGKRVPEEKCRLRRALLQSQSDNDG